VIDILKRLKALCKCHLIEVPCLYCQAHAEMAYRKSMRPPVMTPITQYKSFPEPVCGRDHDTATEGALAQFLRPASDGAI
jgi:hypothetical protein